MPHFIIYLNINLNLVLSMVAREFLRRILPIFKEEILNIAIFNLGI
jgi:hypothetical protein